MHLIGGVVIATPTGGEGDMPDLGSILDIVGTVFDFADLMMKAMEKEKNRGNTDIYVDIKKFISVAEELPGGVLSLSQNLSVADRQKRLTALLKDNNINIHIPTPVKKPAAPAASRTPATPAAPKPTTTTQSSSFTPDSSSSSSSNSYSTNWSWGSILAIGIPSFLIGGGCSFLLFLVVLVGIVLVCSSKKKATTNTTELVLDFDEEQGLLTTGVH